MLKFTASGVVAAPHAVQLRVGVDLGAGLSAGAPRPSRDMTPAEVADAVLFFTRGQRGPRGTPCDTLVVSGAHGHELADAVALARAEGVRQVVVHVSGREPAPAWADELVSFVREPGDVHAALAGHSVVVPLDDNELPARAAALARLGEVGPRRVVLTWPFPPSGKPADAALVAALLGQMDGWMGQVPWQVKGLPACLAGPFAARRRRTRNRWYVDADHQGARAVLFFPDIARYAKVDRCRFCAADEVCDGAPAGWVTGETERLLQPM
jgi:hypothetical protein